MITNGEMFSCRWLPNIQFVIISFQWGFCKRFCAWKRVWVSWTYQLSLWLICSCILAQYHSMHGLNHTGLLSKMRTLYTTVLRAVSLWGLVVLNWSHLHCFHCCWWKKTFRNCSKSSSRQFLIQTMRFTTKMPKNSCNQSKRTVITSCSGLADFRYF